MSHTSLVLGAGGPVGLAFHAGTLAALEAAGWDARKADVIVGTSVGALVGAFFRSGLAASDLYSLLTGAPPSPEGAAIVARFGGWPSFAPAPRGTVVDRAGDQDRPSRRPAGLWASLLTHPSRLRPGIVYASFAPEGSVPIRPLVEAVDRLLGAWPEHPLRVCTVDLATGRRTVVDGPGDDGWGVGTAVAASCAVPGYFAPVELAGRRYVDGGAHSPASTDLAARSRDGAAPLREGDGATVVASVPMGIGAWPGRLGVDLPGRALNHLEAAVGLLRARAEGAQVQLLEPGPAALEVMGYDAFDVARLPEIAERARAETAAALQADGCRPAWAAPPAVTASGVDEAARLRGV